MRVDSLLSFTAIGAAQSLVAAAGVDIPSTRVIDLLGFGVGVVAPDANGNPIIGNVATFGSPDAGGVGGLRPELNITTGTAAVADTGTPTLNVQLQAAIDDGTGNPGTWQTIVESGELTVAQLTANTVIFRSPWLPPFPEDLRPRFLRLNYAIAAGTNLSAGTIASALVTFVRDDWFNRQAAKNFTVSGIA
jgi:hypothetical protein